jgi:hypothetical protein
MRSPSVSTIVKQIHQVDRQKDRNRLNAARLMYDGGQRSPNAVAGCGVLPGCGCCGATHLVLASGKATRLRERYA